MTLRPTFLGVCNEAVQRALAGDHSLDVPNRSRSTHSLTTTSCRCFQTRSASVHSRGHSVRKCASEHASGGVLNIRNPERTFKQYWAPPFSGACRRRPAARAPSDHFGSARRTTPPATRAAAAGPRWSPGSPASRFVPTPPETSSRTWRLRRGGFGLTSSRIDPSNTTNMPTSVQRHRASRFSPASSATMPS